MRVPERGLYFLELRRALQFQGGIAALDRERQRLAGMNADDALHIGEASDRLFVDRRYDVADLKAGRRCGAGGLDLVDARGGAGLAEKREQAGEDHDRQKEIGDWTGGHNRGPPPHILVVEAAGALFLGHVAECFGGRRGSLALVPEELDVAAKRDGRDLPPGAKTVVEPGQFRSKAERER